MHLPFRGFYLSYISDTGETYAASPAASAGTIVRQCETGVPASLSHHCAVVAESTSRMMHDRHPLYHRPTKTEKEKKKKQPRYFENARILLVGGRCPSKSSDSIAYKFQARRDAAEQPEDTETVMLSPAAAAASFFFLVIFRHTWNREFSLRNVRDLFNRVCHPARTILLINPRKSSLR